MLRLEPASSYLRSTLETSLRYEITVYNGLFIAQARNLNVKLVTSDQKQVEIT